MPLGGSKPSNDRRKSFSGRKSNKLFGVMKTPDIDKQLDTPLNALPKISSFPKLQVPDNNSYRFPNGITANQINNEMDYLETQRTNLAVSIPVFKNQNELHAFKNSQSPKPRASITFSIEPNISTAQPHMKKGSEFKLKSILKPASPRKNISMNNLGYELYVNNSSMGSLGQ